MRHGKKVNHLGRKSEHRKAMLSNMANSLIQHKRIKTTLAKAKALRVYVEPLINRSKVDTTHSRRVVFSYLQDKETIKELFGGVAEKVADRPGGYTRILKLGSRLGDNADLCYIELVDYNENMLKEKKTRRRKRTRRGGAGAEGEGAQEQQPKATKPAETEATAEESTEQTAEEAPEQETPESENTADSAEEQETKE